MRIVVTGATGLIGRPLVARLLDAGHTVEAWSRTPAAAERALPARCRVQGWHPTGPIDPDRLRGADTIVHLAGEPVAARHASTLYRARKFLVRHRVPVAAGVNWRFTVHDESGFTNAPAVQVPPTIVNSRGLLLVTDVSWTAALPMLDTVFVTTLLPTPTVTVPKFAAVGIESWLVTPPPNVCR